MRFFISLEARSKQVEVKIDVSTSINSVDPESTRDLARISKSGVHRERERERDPADSPRGIFPARKNRGRNRGEGKSISGTAREPREIAGVSAEPRRFRE